MSQATAHDPCAPVSPEIEAQVQEILKRPYRKVITGDADEGFLIQGLTCRAV